MKTLKDFLYRYRYSIILILILLLGLFFRTYKLVDRFGFGHDADLYSWIVKDISIDGHFRLIGQETSAPGIFIGPLFYYSLVPFYLLFNMDPIGSAVLPPLIGIATSLSYYFVLSKLFNKKVGLIAAFLHAVSWSAIGYDRWVVPTITTKLWAIWYLYTIVQISRGNHNFLALLGILVGLIWHVHLALLSTLIAVPAAILFSRKLPAFKQILLSLVTFILVSTPLIAFELKHGFLQFPSLINNFFVDHGGSVGWYKFTRVIEDISKNLSALIFAPLDIRSEWKAPLLSLVLLFGIYLVRTGLVKVKELIPLYLWAGGVILFFTLSSTIISEYYFTNIEVIFIFIISLLFYLLFKSSYLGRYLSVLLLIFLLARNLFVYITKEPFHVGYIEKKAIAKYITEDSIQKGFPCVAINYINPPGENTGFRYFFYLNNLKLAPPSNKVPVYSIVFPYEWSKNEVSKVFGHIGVINPVKAPPREQLEYDCSGANTNLTDPMFGYVE